MRVFECMFVWVCVWLLDFMFACERVCGCWILCLCACLFDGVFVSVCVCVFLSFMCVCFFVPECPSV